MIGTILTQSKVKPYTGSGSPPNLNVLYIGTANNTYRFSHLSTMGLTVTEKTPTTVVANDLNDKALTVIDNSINSGQLVTFIDTTLKAWTGGVVVNEFLNLDDMDMSAGTSFPVVIQGVTNSVLQNHPITEPFWSGSVANYTFSNQSQPHNYIPRADAGNSVNWLLAESGASVASAQEIFMSYYEVGDSLPNGGTAAGRRVYFFPKEDDDPADKLLLYQRCVDWARGAI